MTIVQLEMVIAQLEGRQEERDAAQSLKDEEYWEKTNQARNMLQALMAEVEARNSRIDDLEKNVSGRSTSKSFMIDDSLNRQFLLFKAFTNVPQGISPLHSYLKRPLASL